MGEPKKGAVTVHIHPVIQPTHNVAATIAALAQLRVEGAPARHAHLRQHATGLPAVSLMPMLPFARIAECREHGLHGERTECFVCGAPVKRRLYVHAGWLLVWTLMLFGGYALGALT